MQKARYADARKTRALKVHADRAVGRHFGGADGKAAADRALFLFRGWDRLARKLAKVGR